ncbi:MAG TPA: hypothetical protein DCM14_07040 [Clostridiales bacterium UBA8153]|nr:hypothetical protein [Clostridiales bacterium UBA8153]
METPEAAQLRELRRFETLVAALQRQVQAAVSDEEGLQGYRSAARLYNRYAEKMDALLPTQLQGLTEAVDVPDLDPDDEGELKTFLSELLFNLGQLQCLISAATGARIEDVHGEAGHWRSSTGDCFPYGTKRGRHHVHVETRLHRRPRMRAHRMPPMPPIPPVPPIPIISTMPGVPQEALKAMQDWAHEMRKVHREWLHGLGRAHRDWCHNLSQPWEGTAGEEADEGEEAGEELHRRRREILAMVENREITVEEAMARLEALKARGEPGTDPGNEDQV